MSFEETKRLLETHRIVPNKLLGQNFMVEPSIYPQLSGYADLKESDVVLDVGAGFGWLTCFLADKCRGVIAVEKDQKVVRVLRKQVEGLGNVSVIEGDVFKAVLPPFNKVIAIPPYYLSSELVTWLHNQEVDCSVLIVQKEFADRLVATVGGEEYGWLTVVTNQRAKAEILDNVPKAMFYPQPQVDSVIARLTPYSTPPFEIKDAEFFTRLVKWLFTERNKKLGKALIPFLKSRLKLSKQDAQKLTLSFAFHERRVRELTPKDFGEIANVLCN